MIDVKRVFPECCGDTLLSELILRRGRPAHNKGITKVSKTLESFDNNNVFIIGVIDTDKFKREGGYIKKFIEIIEDHLEDQGLLIKKVPGTKKHVIRIHPEFEPWLWNQAIICGISPTDYFPSLKDLYKASKDEELLTNPNPNFKKLVNKVVQANPPAIQTMRRWLEKVFET